MLKSFSLFSVLGVALLVVASLPAEDPVEAARWFVSERYREGLCRLPDGNSQTQGEAQACSKNCENCPHSGEACTKNCDQCPNAKQTSATACAGGQCPSTKQMSATACAGGQCPSTKQTSTTACAGGQCPSVASGKDCQDCPITAAMKALPQLTFVVGEEKTGCPKAAACAGGEVQCSDSLCGR